MSVPTLSAVTPNHGTAGGQDLARLVGTGFAPRIAVRFGTAAPVSAFAWTAGGQSRADVLTPPHALGRVDVAVTNLDADGAPISGEEAVLPQAFHYRLPDLVPESDLTRLVRALLQDLKAQVLANTAMSVSVEFDDTPTDGLDVVALAELPSLVLSGPRIAENRFYATNEPLEEAWGDDGEFQRRRPAFTVDLRFTLTGAARRSVELLNMLAAVAGYLGRTHALALPRDPQAPERGRVHYELALDGEIRTRMDGPADVRAFVCDLVIRGFDIFEGTAFERTRWVEETIVETAPHQGGDAP